MRPEEPLRHKFIPDIERKVEKKLKELGLSPKLSIKRFIQKNKRFFSTPCTTKEGQSVFLKILIVDEEGSAIALKREAEITQFLVNYPGLKEKLNIPGFVGADTKNFPYWLLHQYIKGPLIGHFYEIYKEGKKEKYISQINDNLVALQSIPERVVKEILRQEKFNLWKRSYRRYLEMVSDYERAVGNKQGEIDFRKIYKFFGIRKELFRRQKNVIAHGDFTLANFFVSKERVYLTDWEQAHVDNFAYDVSHLWIQAWRYPAWRKKLISDFISRFPQNKVRSFKEIFRMIIITEALGELRWSSKLCKKKYRPGVIKQAHRAIEKALKGFGPLIR